MSVKRSQESGRVRADGVDIAIARELWKTAGHGRAEPGPITHTSRAWPPEPSLRKLSERGTAMIVCLSVALGLCSWSKDERQRTTRSPRMGQVYMASLRMPEATGKQKEADVGRVPVCSCMSW